MSQLSNDWNKILGINHIISNITSLIYSLKVNSQYKSFQFQKLIISLTNILPYMIKQHTKNHHTIIYNEQRKSVSKKGITSKLKQLQNQYQNIQQQIIVMMSRNEKTIQIRIKQWLAKLQAVTEVQQWIRNRNLYSKVLLIMLRKQKLTNPFHKIPSNSSLPKLSLYQIPFDVRKQLEEQNTIDQSFSNNEDQKQNISGISNKNNVDNIIFCHRSRQKYNLQSKIANKHIQQFSNLQETKVLDRQIRQTIRLCYDFILKNMNKFGDKEEKNSLLEQLWNFSTLR